METEGTAIDPVCGMTVNKRTAEFRSFQNGDRYFFGSAGCKHAFDKDPAKYVAGRAGGHEGHHH